MTEMEGEMQRRVYHVRAFEKVDGGWKMIHEGGATVLLEREGGGDWLASVVVCSPLDKFCKRTGLRIADVRMRSHRAGKTVNNVVETGETDTRHAVANAIHEVVSHYHGSKWRQDVRQWVIEHVLTPLGGHEKPTMA
jgi:hypothetical protein